MTTAAACTGSARVGPLALAPAAAQVGDTDAGPGSGNYYSAWKCPGYGLLPEEKDCLCKMIENG